MSEQIQDAAPDLLVVLGRNILPGCSSPEDVRRRHDYLSQESRMNVIAAGELWVPGMDILFCGGQTIGPDFPAEAIAQKDYMHKLYPDVPEANLLTEEKSIDTASNAEEVAKLLRERTYKRIGLLTAGCHLENAAQLFKSFGVGIDATFPAEEAMQTRSRYHQEYAHNWIGSERAKRQRKIEAVRRVLLLVDPKAKIPRLVTSRSRA